MSNYDPDAYVRNEMDISSQEAAFAGFIKWALRVTYATIAVLLFLLIFRT